MHSEPKIWRQLLSSAEQLFLLNYCANNLNRCIFVWIIQLGFIRPTSRFSFILLQPHLQQHFLQYLHTAQQPTSTTNFFLGPFSPTFANLSVLSLPLEPTSLLSSLQLHTHHKLLSVIPLTAQSAHASQHFTMLIFPQSPSELAS